ncbi:hypothetical protein [Oribacterium sp. WCC10]|uniref:hypothetical protein n=1 Tax=Oribacterium sp. WCC10 TaxID=1855343 RepID=UPI0008E7C35F|nr:hypothetical protein [Oribacterium sp. WCC10]SFG24141.1 hypothetical protein SAMN05216356_10422 [Oribacterium sp. WCC10]
MVELQKILELYEHMEKNKQRYLDTIEKYMNKFDQSIASHDLKSFNNIFIEIANTSTTKETKRIFNSYSSFFRLESIKNALNNENTEKINLFWNDVNGVKELLKKYNITIFMIRRLSCNLPDLYKKEAHTYLRSISPYIVNSIINDLTVKAGNENYIYFALATDCIESNNYRNAFIYLSFLKNKTDEVKSLMSTLAKTLNSESNKPVHPEI